MARFDVSMNNPFLPPASSTPSKEDESIVISNRLTFSDPSNHRNTKMQMVLAGVILPFFGWLTFVGFSTGIYIWAIVMGILVVVAVCGWSRALSWFVHPFEFNVEFNSDSLRIWNTRKIGTEIEYHRTEIQRFLIERPAVSFGIKSSRMEKGFRRDYRQSSLPVSSMKSLS